MYTYTCIYISRYICVYIYMHIHVYIYIRNIFKKYIRYPSGKNYWKDWKPNLLQLSKLSLIFTIWATIQFSSVPQSCPTLCHSMDCSTPGLPVNHQLLELIQTHVRRVSDAIQPSHPLSSPSPPAFSLSQHYVLFQWESSLNQVAKVLEFQLQHQSFQWIFMTYLL